ncbi:hypothetical protein [Bordetella sp. BOR01]|uniref:hypothetical protein n=1 Tax=Bordetella sp. BOR01 TaxID=2854779 RepID=UPI001C46B1D1|nr:hypothetical protein [Bordetella sp. BOR01]MBV7483875.1 hypothetical protein [Bordetella sp. BOR01]
MLLGAAISAWAGAGHAHPCDGLAMAVNAQNHDAYATAAAQALTGHVRPASIKMNRLYRAGAWSAAWLDIPGHESGVFFFEDQGAVPGFKEVWGGIADPSEMPELVAWARKLGAPQDLARCFAQVVTAD